MCILLDFAKILSTCRLVFDTTTKHDQAATASFEGKSEKIRFRISHALGKYIGLNIKLSTRIITSHFSHFLSTAGLESGPAPTVSFLSPKKCQVSFIYH